MNDTTQNNRKPLWRSRQSLRVLLSRSILIVLVVAAAVALRPRSATNVAPEIEARVNGEAITSAELHRVRADLLELSRRQGQPSDKKPDAEELERLAVRQLIQRRLMLQEAARRNLSVTKDECDPALNELRGRFADLKGLGAWMQQRGLDDGSLIQTIRDDMLVSRVTAALLEGVVVTEAQARDYYEAHKENLIIGEELRLRIIAVDSREAGQAILTALSNGANFSRLARKYSLGLRASHGGDTGWVDPLTLPPPLRQAVSLKEGEAYGPLEKNADEFLIVALAGRRPVRAKSLDEARPEIERRLLLVKQQEAVGEWLAEQEEKSTIEVFLEPRTPTIPSNRS